ncbi:putative metal-dependent hydrolase related to alanyl-tRNA synthetase HxxxH domain protein [Mesotoga infera]|uniref:Putative metal-dependent hydrolase related to alanyl-tRNA synthetase HxxxH domain protein n=1 Tax=Mesotoga infera TaxID=1236046 RepID=A0A7Z7PRW6_9BACT|nr:alanyl-tRNA editing protein [Mesotoga infera]SSC13222.1 putative metal-dependent hydrolase related to alanyl-tRNA synthetase HxxxH domain protein [Mesotoga infera]
MLEAIREIRFGDSTTLIGICYGNVYVDGEGGQLGDRGSVDGHKILSIKRDGELCSIEIEGFIQRKAGETVDIEIDLGRRRDISVQHTAQHLLSAVFERELGARTVGFQMGEEYSTIDLTISILTNEMQELVEKTSNSLIGENRSVRIEIMPGEIAGKLDLRKAISEKVVESGKDIRIVTIEGIDKSACGGFHVQSTGELRVLKIIKREKVKGDLTRIFFVAGQRALLDYYRKHDLIVRASSILSCGYLDLPDRVDSLVEEVKKAKATVRKLTERVAQNVARELSLTNGETLFIEDSEEIISLIPKYIEKEKYLFVGRFGDRVLLSSKGVDCGAIVTYLKNKLEVKGGAGKERGQFIFSGENSLLKESILEVTANLQKAGEKRENKDSTQ